MKSKILLSITAVLLISASAYSQSIPNYSFETWALDTNYLDLTITNPHLLDTAISANPANWTTSNELTNGTVFHHKTLVTQSNISYTGAYSIQLTTDSVSALIPNTPIGNVNISFVCPGFAVCGSFPINLSAFVNLGNAFNPALLPGAGIPISGRVAKIGGYMKYSPVGGDTAYIIAVLRRGTTVVAQAIYTRSDTDARYSYFEAPFIYQNCLEPDTMVYTVSSGNPYSISGVALGAQTGLHVGSSLLVDSVFLQDTIPGFGIALPVNDSAHTLANTPVHIPVTINDNSCSGGTFTLATGTAPHNGTATVSGDSIIYTPSPTFTGMDTFTYSESIGGGPSASAQVTVRVYCGVATPVNDSAHTNINTAVTIHVAANDPSCGDGIYVLAQGTAPLHGTITISGDSIIYTPDSGYIGLDTFTYTETVGGGTSGTAQVIVNTTWPAGISDVSESKTSIYPNPASNKLYVTNTNPLVSGLRIYNMLGAVMRSEPLTTGNIAVDVSNFSNGLYIIQFSGYDGKATSSARFVVLR